MVVPNSLKKNQMLYIYCLTTPKGSENSVNFVDNLHKKMPEMPTLSEFDAKIL